MFLDSPTPGDEQPCNRTPKWKQSKVSGEEEIKRRYEPVLNRLEEIKAQPKLKNGCQAFGDFVATQLRELPTIKSLLA